MSTPVTSKKRSIPWRRVFQIEKVVVFIGFVVYALLASVSQRPSLLIIMIATLTVGNLTIPLAFACRRLYAARPFPWNWVVFFPVQIIFGLICAVVSILFLQLTKIDSESFSVLFTRIGYIANVIVVVAKVIGFAI